MRSYENARPPKQATIKTMDTRRGGKHIDNKSIGGGVVPGWAHGGPASGMAKYHRVKPLTPV